MSKDNKESQKNKISVHEFYFDTPLYATIEHEGVNGDIFKGDVDGYNPIQKYETTFKISDCRLGSYGGFHYDFHLVTLICKRDEDTILTFIVFEGDNSVVKIGQNPSLADIQFAALGKKYDKLLEKEQLSEFKKSIGLATHGAGAGSLIYLRRLFEDLVIQAYKDNMQDITTERSNFMKLRMNKKVELLEKYLPSQLSKMKYIYSLLSDGIHNLTEKECLEYFPPLKLSVELILDQKIELAEKTKRDESVRRQLQALVR